MVVVVRCASKLILTTFEPPMGSLHRCFGISIITGGGGAFIEGHDDVGSDDSLHVDDLFWCKLVLASVDGVGESYACFCDFPL